MGKTHRQVAGSARGERPLRPSWLWAPMPSAFRLGESVRGPLPGTAASAEGAKAGGSPTRVVAPLALEQKEHLRSLKKQEEATPGSASTGGDESAARSARVNAGGDESPKPPWSGLAPYGSASRGRTSPWTQSTGPEGLAGGQALGQGPRA